MSALFYRWLSAGRAQSPSHCHCPIKISNSVSLIMFLALLLQLPLTLYYFKLAAPWQLITQLIALIACATVPVLNKAYLHNLAVVGLMLVYTSYIVITSLLLGSGSTAHFFLLLGLLISPFTLSMQPLSTLVFILSCMASAFVLLNLAHFDSHDSAYSPYRVLFSNMLLMLCCIACSLYIYYNLLRDKNKILSEKQRADELLLHILPLSIAGKMIHQHDTIADYYPDVTVIFADIADFTPLCAQLSEVTLVKLLNELYGEMDQVFLSYCLEKIKTNGDGVMAVSGAPHPNAQHAWSACEAALRLQQLFTEFTRRHGLSNQLRIGVHTGPAIGGVIGQHKFCYDIWGDTVNLASRLESQGMAGKIQVSHATFQQCRRDFDFECRGRVEIRGMAPITTYWLKGHLSQ